MLNGLKATLSRGARVKLLHMFRQIWDRAITWGYTREVCPLRKASLGPIERGRKKTLLTPEQLRLILQSIDEPYRAMLLVATFTGMRISEIRSVQWGDITGNVLHVRRSMSQFNVSQPLKNHKQERAVPTGHIKAELGKPASAGELCFDVAYQTALYHIKAAAKAAGIEYKGFGWHTFRRCSVTWFRKSGGSIEDAIAQAGYSTRDMSNVYYVAESEDFGRRAEAEAKMFEEIMFSAGLWGERAKNPNETRYFTRST